MILTIFLNFKKIQDWGTRWEERVDDVQFVVLGRLDVIENILERFTQRGGKYGCIEIEDWTVHKINFFFKSSIEYDFLVSLLNDTIAQGGTTIQGITVKPGFTPAEKKSLAYVKAIGRASDSRFQNMNAGLGRNMQYLHPERQSHESTLNRDEAKRPRLSSSRPSYYDSFDKYTR
jgi:hypothetical protein